MLVAQKKYNYEPVPEYQDYQRENKKLKVITVRRTKAIMRFKAMLGILVFFALGIFILLRYSMINEEKRNIYKLKAELNEITRANNQIQVELNRKVDLGEVEKQAIQKLGMQYPDKNQMIYVQIPKTDFTEVPIESENQTEEQGGPASFAKQLLSYLY